jgi:hypothetical protein
LPAPLPQLLSDPDYYENLNHQAKRSHGDPKYKSRGFEVERSGQKENEQQPFEDEHSGLQ